MFYTFLENMTSLPSSARKTLFQRSKYLRSLMPCLFGEPAYPQDSLQGSPSASNGLVYGWIWTSPQNRLKWPLNTPDCLTKFFVWFRNLIQRTIIMKKSSSSSSENSSTTKLIDCSCHNEYQDKRYKGRRLANRVNKEMIAKWRCTVCGRVS